jgi:hypothetical protein
MSVYIDSGDELHHDQAATLALTCPHCQVIAHITPQAVPHFSDLSAVRPKQLGIVYRCDSCNSPIFLRFTVRNYTPARIELSSQFTEIERPREKFTFTHLPPQIEQLFRESLLCFSSGAFNAFASMCRRTARAAFEDQGESGKLRLFDQLNEVRALVGIDPETFQLLKAVIFGTPADSRPEPPLLDANSAAVVLEVMKDLLYEAYVRRGRLQQALLMRKFLADETADIPMPLRDALQRPG